MPHFLAVAVKAAGPVVPHGIAPISTAPDTHFLADETHRLRRVSQDGTSLLNGRNSSSSTGEFAGNRNTALLMTPGRSSQNRYSAFSSSGRIKYMSVSIQVP